MIPTRLNQKVNNGYLAGFNTQTGCLIIVQDAPKLLDISSKHAFDALLASEKENNPGYYQISIPDLLSIKRVSSEHFIIKGLTQASLLDVVYINARTTSERVRLGQVVQYRISSLETMENSYYPPEGLWLSYIPYGFLVLVKYISGSSLNE